jgi:hypothetical protein
VAAYDEAYFNQFRKIPVDAAFGYTEAASRPIRKREPYRRDPKFQSHEAEVLRRRYQQYGCGFRAIAAMHGCSLRCANQVNLRRGAYK